MKNRKNDDTIVKKVVDKESGEERIITLHRNHPKPTTRRQFLASGLMASSGMIVAPSILNVLARPEFAFGADGACSAGGAKLPAFCTVNMSGGASLSGNLPPLDSARQPLPKYDILGLGADQGVHTDALKGRNMFQGVRVAGTGVNTVPAGFFWLGLGLRASQATIDKTSLIALATPTNDDTDNNQMEASGLIIAAGAHGEVLPNLGTQAGAPGTGVGQAPGLIPPPAPLVAGSYGDIEKALAPAGTLSARLTPDRRKKLLELVNSLSGSQARAVAATGGATAQKLSQVVECATGKNIELASQTDPGVDPGLNSAVAGIWGIVPTTKTGAAYRNAGIFYNAIKGNAPTGGVDIGGCDYHGNGRANQNTKDQEGGEMAGRILETAAALGLPVMVHVTTDGSVSSGSGTAFGADYQNDSGSRGMSYLLVYHPAGRPAIKNDAFKHQVGAYSAGQGALDTTVIGTAEKQAVAVLANWLAFAGLSSKLETVAPGFFTKAQLDEVVRIVGS